MTSDTTKADSAQPTDETSSQLFDNRFDRARVRAFIEELVQTDFKPAGAPVLWAAGEGCR